MRDLPAILGGTPVCAQPPAWPIDDPEVADALQASFRDGSWGKYDAANCAQLAGALRDYCQLEHVLLCGSGTFAVELALRALKIGPGDEVILSAYDYPGNFLSIHALGAHPVLVDPAGHNWNFDPQSIPAAVNSATRAVIVSHLHGGLVPMREVMDLARQHHLAVIEDAAQAPGARVQGRRAGTWGDVGILSFGGSKLLSAGRGGALISNRADVYQRARTAFFRGNQLCPLSELQAAVLVPQLRKLDERNQRRSHNVHHLLERLRDVIILRPFLNQVDDSLPSFYKLGFQYAADHVLARRKFVCALRAEGIAFDEGFHAQHVGRSARRFRQAGAMAVADHAHHGAVILHHPVLLGSEREIDEIALAVRKIDEHANEIVKQT